MLNNGSGQHAPWDPTATVYNPITKKNELALFTTDWDNGFFGFVPTGANYNGNGSWSWRTSTGRPTLNSRGTHERKYGRGFYSEQESGKLNQVKFQLTILFTGINTGETKTRKADDLDSRKVLPGVLDCLGIGGGNILTVPNNNNFIDAMKGSPNKKAAENAANNLIPLLRNKEIKPENIQIVAHSNGVPTARYFLDYIKEKYGSSNVGGAILIAPNTKDESDIDRIFAISSQDFLVLSTRDKELNRWGAANLSIGTLLRKKWPFTLTFQEGHSMRDYKQTICGQ